MDVIIRGFKSKKTMEAFFDWYCHQGEDEFNNPDASLEEGTNVWVKDYHNKIWSGGSLILEVEETVSINK